MGRELDDVLRNRQESVMQNHPAAAAADGIGKREKELRGLTKEVVWLRARCRREEGFRRDLAWSKGFMEMGEGIRAAWYVLSFSLSYLFPVGNSLLPGSDSLSLITQSVSL